MQRLSLFCIVVLLSACSVDTTGVKLESTKVPHPKTNSGALVLVEEFSDLQCPACKAANDLLLPDMFKKEGKNIRFEFVQFPLPIHENANEAAMASECAADQGQFWNFIEKDYANQDALSSSQLRVWAKELNMDTDLFNRCIRSGVKQAVIKADMAEGTKRNVQSTPSFFVAGKWVPPSNTYLDDLLKAIDAAVTTAKNQTL